MQIKPACVLFMHKYICLLLVVCFCLLNLFSCDPDLNNPLTESIDTTVVKKDTFFTASYDVTSLAISNSFVTETETGTINDLSLDEVSGICASSHHGLLWMEEDSGNENKIYLVDSLGNTVGSYRLPFSNRDWEDMAIAKKSTDGIRYIHLADIGDNNIVYNEKYIYRFKEPVISDTVPFNKTLADKDVDVIRFKYPDGNRNAEAVMVDPLTNDIFVISKEDQSTIYVARYPQSLTSINVLVKVVVLPISTVTAADISSDGTEVLIKNYQQIFYWKKKDNESIATALRAKPLRLKYSPEPKGESICWVDDGTGFYTTTEIIDDEPAAITFHKR